MNRNRRNARRATFGQAWIESRYWSDILEWIRLAEEECARAIRARSESYRRLTGEDLVMLKQHGIDCSSSGACPKFAEPARLSADVQRGTQPPTPEDQ